MAQDPLEAFLAHLAEERGLSARTVAAYRRDLEAFRTFLGDLDWDEAGRREIRGHVADLHRRGLSARSIQRALAALRTFYRYLIREGRMVANPAEGVPAPRHRRALPRTLAPDQAKALFQGPVEGFEGLRDRALLELLYSSGLRVSEAAGLDLGHLDLDEHQAMVTGKGSKQRLVPIGGKAVEALRAYLAVREGRAHLEETAVFVTRRGRRMSVRAMQDRVRRLSAGAASPHTLRHSCASHLLESSGNLRAVQELLGHTNLGTTQIYTHLDAQHLAAVYDAAHPRARRRASGSGSNEDSED